MAGTARRRMTSSGQPSADESRRLDTADDAVVAEPERKPREGFPSPWGRIIDDVFDLDIEATYRQLTSSLELGSGAHEYPVVLEAIDRVERNAFDAARLVRAARLADEKYSAECQEREEVMRSKARSMLEDEKAAAKAKGATVKAATLQELEDCMLRTWPDEITSIRGRKAEMHGTHRVCEALEKAWWARAHSLRELLKRFAAVGRG